MNLPGVLKDKRVLLGMAGAAGLGLIVLIRNRGGTTQTDTGTGSTPQQFTGTGTFDSSGTDVYNAIQSLGQGWQSDLQEYTSGLNALTTQVSALSTTVGALGTTKAPSSTVTPPINKTLKAGVGWIFVKPGQTVASVAKQYGTTASAIQGLNSAAALNRFSPGETIRIRGRAGAKPPGSK